jgi:glycosyltransferase involved in cell wall biosynthesis
MKFYILKGGEYDFISKMKSYGSLRLFVGTSVIKYKKWFLECLRQYGRIVVLDKDLKKEKFSYLLSKPDAILVDLLPETHNCYDIPRRQLLLSMARLLMFEEAICNVKCFPTAQVELVSTKFEMETLKSIFHNLLPKMYVFPPKVDTDFLVPPDKKQRLTARRKQKIREGQIHLLYAGRWIVTKGICQLIRMLDIWPIPNLILTLAGNIEEDNKVHYSVARHNTFSDFLNNEILQKRRSWLRLQPTPEHKDDLRELFWSADLFINPSIQPDENFGITPREAASCGLPIVTTNFGGLKPLAESIPWKGVDTYPTFFGLRFNLRQFSRLLQSAIIQRNYYSQEDYRKCILSECDTAIAKKNLQSAIEYLKSRPTEKPINRKIQIYKTTRRLIYTLKGPSEFFINLSKNIPRGSRIYGDGPFHYIFPIIQGIYSTLNIPPIVEKHTKWRGFFRISIWEKEKALLEWGFPGPRVMRYSEKMWSSLRKCIHLTEPNDYVISPTNKTQIFQVQQLVNLGYLVPDNHEKENDNRK